ncbi:MAG: hypothetical protein Q4D36_10635, partial [Bacteroidales bacterium]|nr:hypothetical protein [Bacteroidales bacterium]
SVPAPYLLRICPLNKENTIYGPEKGEMWSRYGLGTERVRTKCEGGYTRDTALIYTYLTSKQKDIDIKKENGVATTWGCGNVATWQQVNEMQYGSAIGEIIL